MDQFLDQFLDCGTVFAKDQNHIIVGYGKRVWKEHPSLSSPSWYFPDFFLNCKTPWFTHQFWEIVKIEDFYERLPKITQEHPFKWQNYQVNEFEKGFICLKKMFAEKKILKAVPYLFQTAAAKVDKELLIQMLMQLLCYVKNTSLQLYGFWESGEGMLGATPELLFSVKGDRLRTMACAGTDYGENKLESNEEKKLSKEHRFVIEGIKEELAPYGSSLIIGETKWQGFRSLRHLLTPIEMNLKESISFIDMIYLLHPTAAIGTFPKKDGEKWLKDFNALIPRERFGAPCACSFLNNTLCLVAIRNVQWKSNKVMIGAGSGVIAESNMEKEKLEIMMKLKAIKEMLQL